jgi:hypothetical protein
MMHGQKTIKVLHSLSVFVALFIQNAKRILHIVVCGLSGSIIHIFPYYLINGACVLIVCTFFLKRF